MKLGFGTWQLAGEYLFAGKHCGWGKIDEKEAIKALVFAIENGITFFDTAPSYGNGASEKLLGKVFKDYKRKINVCTKYGVMESSKTSLILDFSEKELRKSVDYSLKRLNLDILHTILLHSPNDDFNFQDFDPVPYEKLKSEGKILNYGVSVKSFKGAQNVIDSGFGNVIEAIFNILDRRAESEIFKKRGFDNYRFIARVPLASGFLNSKYLIESAPSFSKGDIRNDISDKDLHWYLSSVKKLSFLDEQQGGIEACALRYLLFHPHVDYVIPGMRNTSQVYSALNALSLGSLSNQHIEMVNQALPSTNPSWIF